MLRTHPMHKAQRTTAAMLRTPIQKAVRITGAQPAGTQLSLAALGNYLLDNTRAVAILAAVIASLFIAFAARKAAVSIENALESQTRETLSEPRWQWARVRISGRDLRTSGTAPSAQEHQTLIDHLSALRGVRRLRDDIEVALADNAKAAAVTPLTPPIELAASPQPGVAAPAPTRHELIMHFDGAMLTLDGVGGNAQERSTLLDMAQARYTERGVSGQLQTRQNTPQGWLQAAQAGLEALALLNEGRVVLLSNVISVYGTAPDATAAARMRSGLKRRLPEHFVTRVSLERAFKEASLDANSCQGEFNALLTRLKIEFETASAQISASSQPLLDNLAQIARRCPQAQIEIAGHTDDQGTRNNNLRLSQLRAEAVMEYLVQNGVDLRRLVARGYGEERPITDNSNLEARARNRRIEFNVMGDG